MNKKIFACLLAIALFFSIIPISSTSFTVQAAAQNMPTIDFEDGSSGGFEPGQDNVKLTVTSEQSHSGKNSLLVSNRLEGWHGVEIDISKYVEADTQYNLSFWIRLKTDTPIWIGIFLLTESDVRGIAGDVISNKNWMQIRGNVTFTKEEVESGDLRLHIQGGDGGEEFYIDNFSFVKFDPNRKAKEFKTLDFEDGKPGEIIPNSSTNLIITSEEAYSGKNSLLVSSPKGSLGGIELLIEDYIEPDVIYDISMWALVKPDPTFTPAVNRELDVNMSGVDWYQEHYARLSMTSGNVELKYIYVTVSDGWRYIKYRAMFSAEDIAAGHISVSLFEGTCQAEYYIDDFSFVKSEVNENIVESARLPSLKETYKNDFLLRGDPDWTTFDIPYHSTISNRHFDLVSLTMPFTGPPDENGKFFFLGEYISGFKYTDDVVNYLNEIGVNFYSMSWRLILPLSSNDSLPARKPDGTLINRSQAKDILETNIKEIAGHLAGKIYYWEVFGEELINWDTRNYNGEWRSAIRTDNRFGPWRTAYANGADESKGEHDTDFIYDGFVAVRQTDPKAKLAFGECLGEEIKDSILFDMVKELNEKWKTDPRNSEPERLLIEIVQVWCNGWEDVEQAINFFIPLGVKLGIEIGDGWREDNRWVDSYTEYKNLEQDHPNFYTEQAEMYAKTFLLFKKYAEYIDNAGCPIYDFAHWNGYGYDGLFNEDFKPNLSYFAVVDPDGYLAGNFDTQEKRDAWLKASWLNELGLFNGVGTNLSGRPNFDLNRTPTRYEAVTMLVRLLGKEAEARAGTWETPFTDVVDWAAPFVGYAYANGLTSGTSATTFGGDSTVTATQYLTFVLRALGYVSGTDFEWDKAWELSDKIGLTAREYNASNNTQFMRGNVAGISFDGLSSKLKDADKMLYETLIESGVFSRSKAESVGLILN